MKIQSIAVLAGLGIAGFFLYDWYRRGGGIPIVQQAAQGAGQVAGEAVTGAGEGLYAAGFNAGQGAAEQTISFLQAIGLLRTNAQIQADERAKADVQAATLKDIAAQGNTPEASRTFAEQRIAYLISRGVDPDVARRNVESSQSSTLTTTPQMPASPVFPIGKAGDVIIIDASEVTSLQAPSPPHPSELRPQDAISISPPVPMSRELQLKYYGKVIF